MLTTCFTSSVSSADATMSVQQDSVKGNAVAVEESRYVTMPHWSHLSFLVITDVKMMFSQDSVIRSLSFSTATHQICRLARISETWALLQPSEKLLPQQKREKPHQLGTRRQMLPKYGMKQVTSSQMLKRK